MIIIFNFKGSPGFPGVAGRNGSDVSTVICKL